MKLSEIWNYIAYKFDILTYILGLITGVIASIIGNLITENRHKRKAKKTGVYYQFQSQGTMRNVNSNLPSAITARINKIIESETS